MNLTLYQGKRFREYPEKTLLPLTSRLFHQRHRTMANDEYNQWVLILNGIQTMKNTTDGMILTFQRKSRRKKMLLSGMDRKRSQNL